MISTNVKVDIRPISLAIGLSQILYSVWKCVREVSELKYKQRTWENFEIAWNFFSVNNLRPLKLPQNRRSLWKYTWQVTKLQTVVLGLE